MIPKSRYNLSLIFANLLFGVSYSLIVTLLDDKFTAQQLFILQIFGGVAIFLPIAIVRGALRRVSLDMLPSIATYAFTLLYGWCYLTLLGGRATSAVDIASLSTLGPAVTIFAAAIETQRGRERRFQQSYCDETSCIYYPSLKQLKPRRIQLLTTPTILLLLVVVTIIHNTPLPTSRGEGVANLLVVGGVICIAISTTLVRRLQLRIGTTTLLAALYVAALVVIPIFIPNFLGQLRAMGAISLTPHDLLLIVALSTCGTALPLYLLYRGAIHLTPLRTALYRYLQPAVAIVVLLAREWGDRGSILYELRHTAATLVTTLLLLTIATVVVPRWGGATSRS